MDPYVYAVGGYDGETQLRSVERYNIETNEWEFVASMKSPRSGLSVAVLEGKLYALGRLMRTFDLVVAGFMGCEDIF